jgi:hypothetical protein
MDTPLTIVLTVRLPQELATALRRSATEDDRSESAQLRHLMRLGLAEREQLTRLTMRRRQPR